MTGANDLNRMRRQAILSRYAQLDGLSQPTFCRRSPKAKVVFPTRAAAEACRDELNTVDGEAPPYVYICFNHFHLTRTPPKSHRVPHREAS